MKRLSSVIVLVLACMSANAQFYYQDSKNAEMLRHGTRHQPCRTELILPQVNGYNVYKADLHTHTVYSDGSVLPKFRIEEAWRDGLDIMAVTEHIEYRPAEEVFVSYLKRYTDKKYNGESKNTRLSPDKPLDKDGVMVDLNTCVRESQTLAKKYGLTIIPGAEITRDGTTVGHFNALFTTDNNLIYDPDPVVAVRNAKAQNALVMHNHPGWRKTSLNMTPTEKTLYEEGLIDGVEVMNGAEFYPGIVDRVKKYDAFIAANSDIHASTSGDYRVGGASRPMTLVFAKDKSLASVREALEQNRTLALGFDTVCGDEQLLKDFFAAGMKTELIQTNSKGVSTVMVTNCTSIPYFIQVGKGNPVHLLPFSTVSLSSSSDVLKIKVLNMFCSTDGHPVVELKF